MVACKAVSNRESGCYEMEVVHYVREVGPEKNGAGEWDKDLMCDWIPDGSHVRMSRLLTEHPSQTSHGRHAASTQISNNIQAKNIQNRTFHFLCVSDSFSLQFFSSLSVVTCTHS